jgi:ubiquinone/menaquinone biosynthesis C-methylase UbiE
MIPQLQHAMRPEMTVEDLARGQFVSGLRSFILNDLAADMRQAYDARAAKDFSSQYGHEPKNGAEVHKALRPDPAFKVYSAMRVEAQRMVWNTVGPIVAREFDRLNDAADSVKDKLGNVKLAPDFEVPRNVSALDVHLMPGSYTRGGNTLEAGAVYDQGLAVFSMGLMGANLDDIGLSMSRYISRKFPDFQPAAILDMGCTIGHNTLPWKKTYPTAKVTAIDAAGSVLLYGSARAKMQGQDIDFVQMSADALDFPDQSFDLVFSSMFLHEISTKTREKAFAEAYRVLKPGGLMLHMELPPNDQMSAFDGFYLDWDSWYNEEPFYKAFRDQDTRSICKAAGFGAADYLQFVVPSIGIYGADAIDAAIANEEKQKLDQSTGRLAEGVQWFGFGTWKL